MAAVSFVCSFQTPPTLSDLHTAPLRDGTFVTGRDSKIGSDVCLEQGDHLLLGSIFFARCGQLSHQLLFPGPHLGNLTKEPLTGLVLIGLLLHQLVDQIVEPDSSSSMAVAAPSSARTGWPPPPHEEVMNK